MCGLVGLAGDISFKEEKVFKDLLLLDVIRGKHSTGIASLHKIGNEFKTAVFKDKLNAVDFMDLKGFSDLMAKKHHILIGHNRWATKGAIIQENAHPFEFPNIIGAHNGSLLSQSALFEQEKYAVDSQAAFSELNQNGVASLWGKLNGAAALTWIDKTDNTVNFLRNKERPLWFTTANKGRTLVWASEFWMIHVACGRQDLKLDEAPREVQIDMHYKFTLPEKATDIVDWTTTKVEPYVAPKWSGGYYGNYSRSWGEEDKWLDREGVNTGDFVEFTVDTIRDFVQNGANYVDIIGKTLKDVPIRISQVRLDIHDDLVTEMWAEDKMVFTAKVSYSGQAGLYLSIHTADKCYYTLEDLEEAALAESKKEEQLPAGVKFHKFNYKVGCSYCRTLVKEYYTSPDAHICCKTCWEDIKGLTSEQRSRLLPGCRVKTLSN